MKNGMNEEENRNIPEEAKEYIGKLEDISYEIDEFIDLSLHGVIRNKVENVKGKEILKEELNYNYIASEIALERAMEELENATQYIIEIFNDLDISKK